MRSEPVAGMELSVFQEPAYRLHSRIRTTAVVITIFLVLIEIFLVRKIGEQPYNGIILNNVAVARVAKDSPAAAAGILKGDQVVSFNGVPCGSLRDVSECLSHVRPGNTATLMIERAGSILSVPVAFAPLPPSEIARKALLLIVGFSFIGIGLVVYFRRADKLALVFYLLCFAFGLVLVNVVNFELGTARFALRSAFNDLLVLSVPALFLHFFLLFPERSGLLIRRPRLEYAIYLPMVLLFAVSVFFNIMDYSYGRGYSRALAALQSVTALHFIAFVVIGLIAFLRGYRRVKKASFKGKLRLVFWGTIVGILPFVCVQILLSIRPAIEIPGEKVAFVPLILVPMAFGHAIVRYGLMDLEIVFKRSLVYTFLIAVLASVYFVVVYGLGRLASSFIGRSDLLFSIVSIFVISLLISPLRSRIRVVVDRTFFREEYNYRKILRQISHSLAGIISLDSIVSYLSIRVAEVLHAGTTVVFLVDEKIGKYTARYGVNVNHAMLKGFDTDGTLAKHLLRTETTLNVERRFEAKRALPISRDEVDILVGVGAALVVPLILKSNLLGFMTIGRKQSDEFYSTTDIELLETLCDQVSLAVENARLYLETVEKQKMEKELEVAREIQHRLLPKTFPDIPGLQTHAMNLPSKHVGGDYFDVIILGENKVAMVIADVSGKGVPAALLMASLQSSLRAEADPQRCPCDVISVLNRDIFEHTAGGTFVTVFYGVIDFEQRTLTYCNAGQTPPIILSEDQTVKTLGDTDIVIGVDDGAHYHDTTVDLRTGDLVFLYTDGITDELDDQDECFGEARLLDELRRSSGLDLPSIVTKVHDAVVRHTGGKPQDDLTALAIRIVSLTLWPKAVQTAKKN
jgi:sigma-B regulation protein RsbU (phosphoserine phosphatase)